MRSRGRIADASGLSPGDHVCWIFRDDEDHRRVLTTYFAEGVEAGDRLAYFSHDYPGDLIDAYLADRGIDPDDLRDAGRLVVIDARVAYAPRGSFDAEGMVETFGREADRAVAEGFRALRAAGEMTWVLEKLVERDPFLAYEIEADRVAARAPLIGLCAYDRRRTEPRLLDDIAAVHPTHLERGRGRGHTFRVFAAGPEGIAVRGEVDFVSVEAFGRFLEAAGSNGGPVMLDLSQLTFIDVAGLRAVGRFVEAAGDRRVVMTSASRTFVRCWALMGLDRLTNVEFSSVAHS